MAVDCKETLNLPTTDFPMKANLPEREPQVLQRWQAMELYAKLQAQGRERPRFVLHDGPPYANARPHMGTALNKILKDIVVKSKILSGYDAPFVPGWDCHGLPIELNVEKKYGKPGSKLNAKAFRSACRAYAKEQLQLQLQDFQRLGILADWQHPYLTMDFNFEADTVRALAKIIEKGHLHRGQKPVHWCVDCASALAEAEVEYKEKTSPAIDVAFAVVDVEEAAQRLGAPLAPQAALLIPIWTTTPWTLPANQAVAVHPEMDYVLWLDAAATSPPRYFIFAQALQTTIVARYGLVGEALCTFPGRVLAGIRLQHPLPVFAKTVPVILGMHVTTDTGTGCVHTAPAHGHDDFIVGQQYQLPMDCLVDDEGRFFDTVPLVGGQKVLPSNPTIIEGLALAGALLHSTTLAHSYPHCWRHKTPLIFRATPQWFISMEQRGLRAMAEAAIAEVKWVPGWGQTRIHGMIAERPDWCISRQRTWGAPIPLFIHKQTQTLHPKTSEWLEYIAKQMEQEGLEAWYDLDMDALLGSDAKDYTKTTDTLDVWFESGISHEAVLARRPNLSWPADLYLEGSDQHRGWFQSSLLTAVAIRGEAPYKSVVTHGYVVDAKGFKMSKSLGNVLSPMDVVKQWGADVLRLWVAASDYRSDISFSNEILKRSADTYRRIRNTARFFLSNLFDFDFDQHALAAQEMLPLDRWVLDAAARLQQDLQSAYEAFHFQKVDQLIHNFCTVELGSFYLDVIKDRLYTAKRDHRCRRSAQTALFHLLQALVRWIAPILSFTAEEIWQFMPGQKGESIFLETWYKGLPLLADTEPMNASFWETLQTLRTEVNKLLEQLRHAETIGSALEARVTLFAEDFLLWSLLRLGAELRFVLIVSDVQLYPLAEAPVDAQQSEHFAGIKINVEKTEDPKCMRCWQRRADVGAVALHPEWCGRCIENVEGPGEARLYA